MQERSELERRSYAEGLRAVGVHCMAEAGCGYLWSGGSNVSAINNRILGCMAVLPCLSCLLSACLPGLGLTAVCVHVGLFVIFRACPSYMQVNGVQHCREINMSTNIDTLV